MTGEGSDGQVLALVLTAILVVGAIAPVTAQPVVSTAGNTSDDMVSAGNGTVDDTSPNLTDDAATNTIGNATAVDGQNDTTADSNSSNDPDSGNESVDNAGGATGMAIAGRNGTDVPDSELAGLSQNATGNGSSTVEVVVRVEEFEIPDVSTASRESVIDRLQKHAERTQQPILEYVNSTSGLTVLKQFWITNALLLRVDTSSADAHKILDQPGVTHVHRNFEFSALSTTQSSMTATSRSAPPKATSSRNVTYGLDQLDVPSVWSKHGTRGAGAKVAVLDTGVAVSHPDINLYTDQPGNETYPGGWAEFDTNGDRISGSTPHATSDHGTHVTGTVGGDDASGTAIGVAPDANVMHGLVLPDGTGSFAQIISGMQWATTEDADVISMSLGADGYYSTLITPIRNAEQTGTVVVAAAGNHGPETAPSPGSIYDAITVGASDSNRNIAPFSGGDVVRTERDWGDAAPADWPAEYVVPDIAAPGNDIYSTLPGNEYGEKSGTSMATPQVAGVVALMISAAGGDLSPDQIKEALRKSATKPSGETTSADIRYGHGIIDALAATTAVAADQGITGSVTADSGDPIDDASVSLDSGVKTGTDATGDYLVRTLAGAYNVTVSAFGYVSNESRVTVDPDTLTTLDVGLEPKLEAVTTTPQTAQVEAGEAATVTYRLAHAETLTVSQVGDFRGNATLTVDGTQYSMGESIQLAGHSETGVRIRVETDPESSGTLRLEHTATGLNDSTTITTGPTDVVGDPIYVGVVDSTASEYAKQTSAAIEENVPDQYFVSIISPQEAMQNTERYDIFAVHQVGSETELAAFAAATSDPATGVVYLDQWGAASNGVSALSKATQNPVVTGQDTKTDDPSYEVVSAHPIFEGIATVGDAVTIHDQRRGDIAWFDRYAGTPLAMASDGEDRLGTGISVDESTQTILLSSLGRSSTVRNTHVTSDANSLLGNAVEYVNTRPPAWFESTQPKHVSPGNSFTVNVTTQRLRALNVTLTDSTTLDEEDLTLSINGAESAFGDRYSINRSTETVEVTVDTASDLVGSVSLSITAHGQKQSVELLSGRTAVYTKPLVVPEDTATIQEALNLVPAGGTVEVTNGTHTGPVEVTTPGVTLTAHGANRPTITAQISGFYDPVVHVDAPNVTVERLNVVANGFAPDGITVDRANATVRHVSVTGASHGVLVGGAGTTADNAVVHDVNVTDGASLLAIGVTVGEADNAHVYDSTISGQDSGVDVYTSTGTVVENNTVTDSAAGLTSFDTDRLRFHDNEIHDMDESSQNTVGIQLEGFVTNVTVSDNKIWNLSEGVYVEGTNTGGKILRNEIDTEYGVWVDRGDAPAIEIRHNHLAATDVPIGNGLETSLRATMNYLGDRGGNASIVSGDVVYEPFLTEPPEEVDTDEPRRFGIDLTLEDGSTYGVSVPGPTQQTVSGLFDDEFEGVVYGFDTSNQSWVQLDGDDSVASLQGLAVVAESKGRMTVTHHLGDDRLSKPSQRKLDEGWNFVGAPTYGSLESAYDIDSIDLSLSTAPFLAPGSQPGPSGGFDGLFRFDDSERPTPNASAYESYFVFADESGTLPSYVVPSPSSTELYEEIGLYTENTTAASETETLETVSVASTLSRLDGRNRSAVRATLTQLLYRRLSTADRGQTATRTDLDSTADEIVRSAPEEHRTLVETAVESALRRVERPGQVTGYAPERGPTTAANQTVKSQGEASG